MVFGGVFSSRQEPFESREVSVISAQDFDALMAAQSPPATVSQPAALPMPDIPQDTPDVQAETDVAPDQVPPSETSEPETDIAPKVVPTLPTPDPEVADVAPLLQPPVPAVSDVNPTETPRPVVRPVERVAAMPVAPAPPDVKPDDVVNPEVSPDQGAETPREVQEATAPEEASDKIVTEADKVTSHAPARSVRPPASRPVRPTAAAAPQTASNSNQSKSIEDALGQALAGAETSAPVGPPLSQGEKDALRASVSRCWNVGSLSTEASKTTVVVSVSMKPDGKPETSSVRLVSSSGGSDGAAKQAFEAARRAIIRCGASGFELPAEKYARWRDIEMTFNPERMRIK